MFDLAKPALRAQ